MPRPGSALLLLLLGLVACAAPEEEPSGNDAGVATGSGTLSIENNSGAAIFRVRFAPAAEKHWGPDRLAQAEVIKPGKKRSWTVPAGAYRVQIEFRDGSSVEGVEQYTVEPDREAICAIFGADAVEKETGVLTLENATGFAIANVYFSLTSKMSWGKDRLDREAEILPPGKRRSWKLSPGRYQLKVKFQDATCLEGHETYEVVAGEETVCRIGGE